MFALLVLAGGACSYDLSEISAYDPFAVRPTLPALPGETVALDALAAYWPLDDGQGIVAWDATDHRNDGVLLPIAAPTRGLTGPEWRRPGRSESHFNNAGDIFFDGIDDYVEFQQTFLPAIGTPLSMTLWARYDYDVLPDQVASLFVLLNRDAAAGLRIELRRQRLRVATYFTTDESLEVVGLPAPPQGWHFIAYTFDGTTHALYVDDASPVTSTVDTKENGAPNRCRIGRSSSGVPDAFKGFLDDVRVYGRALTAAEVGSLRGGAP